MRKNLYDTSVVDVKVTLGGFEVPAVATIEAIESVDELERVVLEAQLVGSTAIQVSAEAMKRLVELLCTELFYVHPPEFVEVHDLVQTALTCGTWPYPSKPIGPWFPRNFFERSDDDADH